MSIHVTLRQLRLFLALAERGSVSAAARACHVTQPTVSMQLKEIGEAVGLPLYEVVGKRVFLTATGEDLARTARAMLDEWESFSQRIDAARGLTAGRLKVAVVSTAKYFVPRFLGTFCQRHPEVDIALEVLNRDGVVQRLRENRDDLYVMSAPPRDLEIVSQAFMANPLVVVAPPVHPRAGARRATLAQLGNEQFVMREQGSGTRLAVDAHFRAHAFQPRIRLELGSNEAIKQAVAGGLGIAVLSRHALEAELRDGTLVELAVRNFPIHDNWFVVYPRGKRLSPLATAFLETLRFPGEANVVPRAEAGADAPDSP